MTKRFIFGRHKDDPKGPPEEKGEVIIDAPSLQDARKAFIAKNGGNVTMRDGAEVITSNDPRFPIVRAEWIGEQTKTTTKKARTRKR